MSLTRVMVVDDNEAFLEMAAFVLNKAGYVVETVLDAARALVRIPEFRPELIVMDVQMPVMDGMELTRRLKADPATQHIVIVAFTAFALKGDAPGLRAAGFDGFIAKPVNVATFVAEIRFWFEGPESARGSHFVWP